MWWCNYSQTLLQKIKIEHISGSTVYSLILYSLNLLCVQVEGYRATFKLRCRLLVFTLYKAFSKNKKRPGTSPIAMQPKSISLEQICYERSQGIAVTSLHCLLFLTSKSKDLKRISKGATNVVLALKFLWTSKFVFPW